VIATPPESCFAVQPLVDDPELEVRKRYSLPFGQVTLELTPSLPTEMAHAGAFAPLLVVGELEQLVSKAVANRALTRFVVATIGSLTTARFLSSPSSGGTARCGRCPL
jgi:hypothetical protein